MRAQATNPLRGRPPLIAPAWHTLLLALFIASGPLLGALLGGHATVAGQPRTTALYLPMVASEAMFLFLVWVGLRPMGVQLRQLFGPGWRSGIDVAHDAAIALAAWVVTFAVERLWPGAHTAQLLPTTMGEKLAWVGVALAAAICEELVFRGYLLRQLEALSGSAALAVVVQAALFSLPHAEQGLRALAKIALYGVCLGLLARREGGVRACIVAHASVDLSVGLLR